MAKLNQEKVKTSSDSNSIQMITPTFVPMFQVYVDDQPIEKSYKDKQKSSKEHIDQKKQSEQKKSNKVSVVNRSNFSRISYLPFSRNVFTASDYNKMLIGTGLKGYGETFKNMETKYKVNALFAIAVAMHESALGFSPLPGNNYFGMIGMKFDSTKANIDYFGRLMSGSIYSCFNSIDGINSRYAEGNTWAGKVKIHMQERVNKVK